MLVLRCGSTLCRSSNQNTSCLKKLISFQPRTSSTASAAINQSVPFKPSRAVGVWLAGCSGMVAGAVLLGGMTCRTFKLWDFSVNMVLQQFAGLQLSFLNFMLSFL